MTIIVHVTGLSSGKTLLESWPRSLCDQMGNCNFCAFFLFLDQIWPVTMTIFVENHPSVTSGSFWTYKPSPFKIRNASSLYRELQAEVWFVWNFLHTFLFFLTKHVWWPRRSFERKASRINLYPLFSAQKFTTCQDEKCLFFYRSQPAKAWHVTVKRSGTCTLGSWDPLYSLVALLSPKSESLGCVIMPIQPSNYKKMSYLTSHPPLLIVLVVTPFHCSVITPDCGSW